MPRMLFGLCGVTALGMALLVSSLPAQPVASKAAEVRQLMLQLNSDVLADRDAAEKDLLLLGPTALPLLPAVKPSMPAELQQRLTRIRGQLEQRAADVATKGSRVTLQGKYKLSVALAKLSEQSGNQIVDYREELRQDPTDPEIEVDLQDVLFWEGLDKVLDAASLVALSYINTDEPGIAVGNPHSERTTNRWISYDGPFRIELVSGTASRDFTDDLAGRLNLTALISCEPRLKPIVMALPMDSLAAETSNGKKIAGAMGGKRQINVSPQATSVDIPLELPSRDATSLRTLSGKFTALLPGNHETFRFDKLPIEEPQEQRRAGAIVALDKVRKNNDVWEVRMRVRFDNPSGALDSHLLGWVLENKAYLEDGDGKKVEPGALEKTREVADEFGVAYLFFPEGEISEYTFVYQTPAALTNREVKFEFKDVPLP